MVLAIIGQAGAGKTTATKFFAVNGAYIIAADELVKIIYQNKAIIEQVIAVFGHDFLNKENYIDKKKLREYVFNNHQALIKLEKIIWPNLKKAIIAEIQAHQSWTLVIIDCALLFKLKIDHYVDQILLIKAKKSLKLSRVSMRDQVDLQQVVSLLNWQKQSFGNYHHFDYYLTNNGTFKQFEKKLAIIQKKIMRKGINNLAYNKNTGKLV